MVITYNGVEFVKVQSGETTIVFNPVSKESKIKMSEPRFKADIALITLNHPDFNGVTSLSSRDKDNPFVIDSPGEYEIQEIFIKGFQGNSNHGGETAHSTIYKVLMEDINLCFMGALSQNNLSDSTLAELDDTDILFIPIGGKGVLEASEAYKLAVKVSPKIIIPIHHEMIGEKDALKKFIKEGGVKKVDEEEKLTLRKSNLTSKEGEIVVLKGVND